MNMTRGQPALLQGPAFNNNVTLSALLCVALEGTHRLKMY